MSRQTDQTESPGARVSLLRRGRSALCVAAVGTAAVLIPAAPAFAVVPTLSLVAAPTSGNANYGDSVTLTATFSNPNPSPNGFIDFTYGANKSFGGNCDEQPIVNNGGVLSATCSGTFVTTTPGAGTPNITATYTANDEGATPPSATITNYKINKALDVLSNFTGPSSGAVGGTGTASATGGGSSKPVVIKVDGTTTNSACSVESTGDSPATIDFNNEGTCVLNATQAQDSNYQAASPLQISFPVKLANTITNVSFPSGTVGGSGQVTATAGVGSAPLVFSVDTVDSSPSNACHIASSSINPNPTQSSATIDYDHAGSCWIDVNQAGDADHAAAAQVSGAIMISKANLTSFTLSAIPATQQQYGQNIELTATPTGSAGPSPTGEVNFSYTIAPNPAVAIAGCQGVPLSSGQAVCNTTSVPVGTNITLSALYINDPDYNNVGAALLTPYTVTPASSDVEEYINPPTAAVAGTPVTIYATIYTSGGGNEATGTVKFTDNGKAIKGCTAVPVADDGWGDAQASCTTSKLAPTLHTIKVVFSSGDGNYTNGSATIKNYQVGNPV